jgi:hypothetical protein
LAFTAALASCPTAPAQENDAHHERDLYHWAQPKDGIRLGARLDKDSARVSVALGVADESIETQYVPIPKMYVGRHRSFSLQLVDPGGKPVPQTQEGKRFLETSSPVTLSYTNSNDYQLVAFFGQAPCALGSCDVKKCFDVQHGGNYSLVIRITVLRDASGKGDLTPVRVPELVLPVQIPELSKRQGATGQ